MFSHEELVCKMAADPDSMDLQLAAYTHKEMCAIVEFEREHRRHILEQVCYLSRNIFMFFVHCKYIEIVKFIHPMSYVEQICNNNMKLLVGL